MTLDAQGGLPPAQRVAERIFSAVDRFLHVEALSGVVLLLAAIAALCWANVIPGEHYEHFWHTRLTLGAGAMVISQPLHFWVNDCLMTIFFLVVGLEIRREIHDGALATTHTASLPIAAAAGGIFVPAIIYLVMNPVEPLRDGWAIPTATDIAFAVGVLALIGRSIPTTLRVFLLALAVIDDLVGVLIIAVVYSGGIELFDLWIAAAGVLLTLIFQTIGVARAWLYVLPGMIVWLGFARSGIHPTLAGVVLGFITPVRPTQMREPPIGMASRAIRQLADLMHATRTDSRVIREPLKLLQDAQRELLPPVTRVQMALHPWVAYVIMPAFALANAGIELRGDNLTGAATWSVTMGIVIALVAGKPIGILAATWLAVRAGWCELPMGLNWRGIGIAGCLGGIGFTMSIFIATLAFPDADVLEAAKRGVLIASAIAGTIGFALGRRSYPRASGGQICR